LVAKDIADQLAGGSQEVFGVMIESNLHEGRQDLVEGQVCACTFMPLNILYVVIKSDQVYLSECFVCRDGGSVVRTTGTHMYTWSIHYTCHVYIVNTLYVSWLHLLIFNTLNAMTDSDCSKGRQDRIEG
jgi:hypothetical protein